MKHIKSFHEYYEWQSKFTFDYVIVGIYVGERNQFEILKESSHQCESSKGEALVLKSDIGVRKEFMLMVQMGSLLFFGPNFLN